MATEKTDTSLLVALYRALEALTAAIKVLTTDRAIAVNDVPVSNTPAIGSAALHAALDAVERYGRPAPVLSVIEGGRQGDEQP